MMTCVHVQGDWAAYFLQPYVTQQSATDLFAFRSPTPWVLNAPGWETSNCFSPLKNYPKGWRARGENATNLPVEWGDRIACFMPSKRMSRRLLQTLNSTYLSGEGGYNEVVVPTVNAVSGGTFGTAHQVTRAFQLDEPLQCCGHWHGSGDAMVTLSDVSVLCCLCCCRRA